MTSLATEYQALYAQAQEVLTGNWIEIDDRHGFTRPAQGLYPYQWNWDSGLISYAYTHYDIPKAIMELRALFSAQWDNGFLPHMVFHDPGNGEAENYFPGPDVWNSARNAAAPTQVKTSGITQPPVHGMIARHVYRRLREDSQQEADTFLEEFFPKLLALHRYLYTYRDPEAWGLITIYHPWESGMDNSPRWDETLGRIQPDVPDYVRADTTFVDDSHRPTKEDYDRYIALLLSLQEYAYDDLSLYENHPFLMKDAFFSAVLYASCQRLLELSKAFRPKHVPEIEEWMSRYERHALDKLWDEREEMFCDYDVMTSRKTCARSAASLLPIISNCFPAKYLESVLGHLGRSSFCGKDACVASLVPSLSTDEELFSETLYWRGPLWINVNWFFWKAFGQHGLHERADLLRSAMLQLVDREGFREYYSPISGEGLGARDFSWTASLTIDLLEH